MSIPTSPARRPNERKPAAEAIGALLRAEFGTEDLLALSDVSRSDATALAVSWPAIPLEARIAAIRQLAEIAEDRVDLTFGRVFRVALDDASPVVRQLAIDALWEDDGADFLERLLRIIREDESMDVRAAAAQGLARFAEGAAIGRLDEAAGGEVREELLVHAADTTEPYIVRRRALESLAVFGTRPEVVVLIRAAYDADDEGIRAGALYAMGRTMDRRWLNILLSELDAPDAEMRYEAARACGEIGDAVAVPGLTRCAEDRDAEVRQAAIAALGQIASAAAVKNLRGLAATARPADREAIQDALGEAMSDADL